MWNFELLQKSVPKLTKPVLIVGLPGIANVGKIAADFIIDEVKAKKLYNVVSYDLPNSVFVNDKNLVELPVIEVYYKKLNGKGHDLLILTGDVQPTYEASCYEFCEAVLDKFQSMGGAEIVTLGGIGLSQIPKKPTVYCTAKPDSLGCAPSLSWSGTPSASAGSGFDVTYGPVPGNSFGLYIFSLSGPANPPTQGPFGFLCLPATSIQRTFSNFSGGTFGSCDGAYTIDFNQYIQDPGAPAALGAGSTVDMQVWYRDPANPGGANLSNAISFLVCP